MATRMMRLGGIALCLVILGTLGACASSSSGGGGSMDVLTNEDLVASRQNNLYQAVQALRPRWLRSRGANSLTQQADVVVFLNEAPFGTVNDLGNIPIDAVREIRFLSAAEAGSRYGTAAGSSGLLLVRTAP